MASGATKAGSLYLEIRAEIKKLSQDLAAAEAATKQSVDKMHKTIEKGIDFGKVAAGATAAAGSIYAAFRAVGQAIESAKVGSMLDKQAKSFSNLSDAAGTSSKRMLESLKGASQGLVAEADLMAASGKALLMSIPADKISELMKIAAATSKMTGQSITEAFNDITMGVARQSRMILDNLGIIVNVDKANQDYAQSLGKTAEALNDVEKRQAFMNAVLKAGADMIKRLGSQEGYDGVARATAEWNDALANLNRKIAEESNPLFEAVAAVLRKINIEMKASSAAAAEYGSSIESIDARIEALNKKHGDMAGRKASGYNEPPDVEYRRLLARRKTVSTVGSSADYMPGVYEAAGLSGSQRASDNQVGYDVEGRWKIYEEGLKSQAEAAKKASEEIKRFHDEISKLEAEFESSKVFGGESSNAERMEAQLRSGAEVSNMIATKNIELEKQRQKMAELDDIANQERWFETYVQGIEDATRANEIFNDTMNIMSQNMSDAFSKMVTGSLSAKDAFVQMSEAIIASMVRMASQKMFEDIFGLIKTGISLYGAGETPTGMGSGAGVGWGSQAGDWGATMHGGGVVGASGGAMRHIPSSYFATAPRLHGGLMADEYPAVLQKGEQVIPKGRAAAGGGDTYNVYNISAIDTQSFVDAARKSGAVPLLAAENINQNGGLRRSIVTRAR